MPAPTHEPSTHCALEPIRQVLVGSTLDEASDEVVRAGVALAQAAGARLELLHAAEMEPIGAGPDYQAEWLTPATCEAIANERQQALWAQIHRIGITDADLAGARVVIEAPHRALLQVAEEISADLIVIGATTGIRPFRRLLGSTADRVARKATCPVLMVRGALKVPPRWVLAPVDLSLLSGDAFRCGLDFLVQIGGGGEKAIDVEALFVLDPEPQRALRQFSEEQVERFAQGELAHFVDEHSDPAVRVHPRLRRGEARREILHEIGEGAADLVLIGTHGHGGLDRLLLGSVAAFVTREAPVSVLLIPPAIALGAAIADAVVSQTAPVWHLPADKPQTADRS